MKLNFAASGVPVAPLMGFPGTCLTGTTIKENLEDADIQFKSLNSLFEKYRPDAMFTMMDLTVEAEALGLKILKPDDASYTVVEHPVADESDLALLKIPDPFNDGRMPQFIRAVELMHKNIACSTIAYVIGPYTLAGLMNGAAKVIKNVIKKPDFLRKVLDVSTETIDRYAKALIDAGADAICILEPTATVLSPEDFNEFSGKYVKKLIDGWNAPAILHICGDTEHLVENMIKTGAHGISLDTMVNFGEIKNIVPEHVLLIGNIDPVNVIAYGDEGEVYLAVNNLLKEMQGSNFVLSTGCDLPKDTKLDNISIMIDLAKKS